MNKEKAVVYKSIWLRTQDANLIQNGRISFTFNQLPLIQVRGRAILKVNSVSVGGSIVDADGHNWTIKLEDVKYNRQKYFNSDKGHVPTLCTFNFDSKNSIQNSGFALELTEQDINNITLKIYSDERPEDAVHGLIKNSKNIEMTINLIIEEY